MGDLNLDDCLSVSGRLHILDKLCCRHPTQHVHCVLTRLRVLLQPTNAFEENPQENHCDRVSQDNHLRRGAWHRSLGLLLFQQVSKQSSTLHASLQRIESNDSVSVGPRVLAWFRAIPSVKLTTTVFLVRPVPVRGQRRVGSSLGVNCNSRLPVLRCGVGGQSCTYQPSPCVHYRQTCEKLTDGATLARRNLNKTEKVSVGHMEQQ